MICQVSPLRHCLLLLVCPNLRREQASALAEHTAEIGVVGKAAQERGLLNAVPSALQKTARVVTSYSVEIVYQRVAGNPLELPQKVKFA